MPEIIYLDPVRPAAVGIEKAVSSLRSGKLLAYPTETFYGLAADGMNEAAITNIFRIKGRSFHSPIALIIAEKKVLDKLTTAVPKTAARLLDIFWPGPLTLVFAASPSVSPLLTAGTGKIGIRISSHPVAHALAAALGGPITATSANLSGCQECTTVGEVREQIHSDLLTTFLDGGTTPGGKGSTFVDVTTDPPSILRAGAIPAAAIKAVLRERF
ncbi:MAG TPA: L-threonylcarbamoyladenylate synthase [Syntrophales bacterium]|jgi:L-threonylcarbamoyladenylate synthase|nr:L-threonylcarbamoyladenylate synthase [Syntrophales bacterium]HON22276.1 L-threonylcarbamoyladenylate synthase [Syntrophales bacterium]HOU77968.1 L-threonylcarbamoyladenylate synthase [Syntrophales bacterium]HPC32909.1 L-threonylcarbamoyladenylate synthase [Syntrophales bacterium]HQG34166.1 L-threonylcarbamoyladenylate synthase [Syntrophales bacterium]